jgi:putative ABC transport system permease protein
MRGSLYLAWRYLAAHRLKTAILVASITLILYLPLGLRVLVVQSERMLRSRAEQTPLLVGLKGSPLELALNSLYFATDVPETLEYGQLERIARTGFANPIPLDVRFRAGEHPIVGTSLDYFDLRRLRVERGGMITRLGDCVIGSTVASRHGLGPGDAVISSPESVFDLAGTYPLKMRVTGVLAPSGGPDDDAVFVDVKTSWVIQGLAHGHQDLSRPEAASEVLKHEGNVYVGNASVVLYNEITDDNVDTFHFHGDVRTFPITAIIAVPRDARGATLLRGRYLGPEERHQILRPTQVIEELMDTVFTIQGFVVAALAVVGIATLATSALVFWLSIRLRRREIETLNKIGGSRMRIAAVLAAEVVVVVLLGALLAGTLTAVTAWVGSDVVQNLVR